MPFSLCKSQEGENINQKPVHACWNPQKPPGMDCASHWGVQRWGCKNVKQTWSREKGNEKVKIQTCVCELRSFLQNRGKNIQYRIPVGFFLGIMPVLKRPSLGWGRWMGHWFLRKTWVKVKYNNAWNELKFWMTLISETAVNMQWCFYLCFQLNQNHGGEILHSAGWCTASPDENLG